MSNTNTVLALYGFLCLAGGYGHAAVFYPSDDTYVSQSSPTAVGGSGTAMAVRNAVGWGGAKYQWDSLIKFDLSALPPGEPTDTATLYLYCYLHGGSSPAGRELTCRKVMNGWTEGQVTWNTRPSSGPQVTGTATVPETPGNWMAWDVTSDVQAFAGGVEMNHGWAISDEVAWGMTDIPFVHFRTKEYGSFSPYLEVIPEPATLVLLGYGGLAMLRQRRPGRGGIAA